MVRMILKALRARLLLVGLLVLAAVPALTADALFEARVPVADRSVAAREAAQREALAQVLTRLTGERGPAQVEASAALLADPGRYMQQYSYETDTRMDAGRDAGGDARGLLLRVVFDSAALEAAARRAGLPLWGAERPPVLIWLALDDGDRRYLLGGGAGESVEDTLQAAARRRGLTLIVPLLDLEDQAQVRYSDVRGGFLERVYAASARYQAPVVLVARVQRLGAAAWTSRWTQRVAAGDEANWQTGGADLQTVLDAGLGQAAERLAGGLAAARGDRRHGQVDLAVAGVTTLADYARVSDYLNGLAPVAAAQLTGVRDGRLDYRLDVEGGVAMLEYVIRIGGLLERLPERTDAAATTPGQTIHYRLRP